jgi:ribosome biogenesis GTPase / thiamine phosphate phosphatase
MNVHKREKRKFHRVDVRIRNLDVEGSDAFEDELTEETRKAEKKTIEKGGSTHKSDVTLRRGRVLEVRSNHQCAVDLDGVETLCTIGGRLKQVNFETRTLLAVGDFVNVDIGKDARVEEILPRANTLSRFSEAEFQTEAVIAANVDQVVIVAAVCEPEFKPGLIDRYICAAGIADIDAVLCVNKIDLAEDFDGIHPPPSMVGECEFYTRLGITVLFVSAEAGFGLEELTVCLRGKETVFSGHSGVGKTALLHRLQPDLETKTLSISESTGKGRHSTTFSRLLRLDLGGYLVDTPGVRTFGLHRRDAARLPRVFPGFDELAAGCRFTDCTHSHEQDCAVKQAVEEGLIPEDRYDSYLRILESLS